MSNYETSLKASLDNLSDDEISKKLKTGNLSGEARVVTEQVLNEREFGDNKSVVKGQAHHAELESSLYLNSEQNKKYVKGKVIVWMVTLFLIGAGFAQSLCLTPLAAVMLRGTEQAYRGRVMGMRMLAIWGLPLGLLMSGPLINNFGFHITASVYSLIGLGLTVTMTYYWRVYLWRSSSVANSYM